MKFFAVLVLMLAGFLAHPAKAYTCGPYPFTFANNTVASGVQVMSNFNWVLGCVNTIGTGFVIGPITSTIGDLAAFADTTGTTLMDVSQIGITQLPSIGNNTVLCNQSGGVSTPSACLGIVPVQRAVSSSTSASSADCGGTITASGSFFSVTLGAPGGFLGGCRITVANTNGNGNGTKMIVSGLTTRILYPGQTITYVAINGNGAWGVASDPGRWNLTSNPTIFVNASGTTATCGVTGSNTCSAGSDSNDGLGPSSPLATAQAAVNLLFSNINVNGHSLIINFAHGSSNAYSFSCIQGPEVGQVTFSVVGDYSNPTAVKVVGGALVPAIFVKDQCVPQLSDLEIDDGGTTTAAVSCSHLSNMDLRSVIFGSFNSTATLVQVNHGCVVDMLGRDPSDTSGKPNTITGGFGIGFSTQSGGVIDFGNGSPISIPNAVNASISFMSQDGGSMVGLTTTVFTGSGVSGSTGTRCLLTNGSIFDANGFDPNVVFPGNVNCIPQNGLTETWTPTLVGSVTPGSATYAATCGTGAVTCQIGTVRIVGTFVHLSFKIVTISLGSAAGNLQVGNLPVQIGSEGSNLSDDAGGCSIGQYSGWTGDSGFVSLSAVARGTGTALDLIENGSGKTGQATPVSDYGSAVTIVGSCTYHT